MSCLLPCWIPSRYPRASAGARPASARKFATWRRSGPTAGKTCSASGGSVATGRCWDWWLKTMLRSCQARQRHRRPQNLARRRAGSRDFPQYAQIFGSMVPAWIRRALRIVGLALFLRCRIVDESLSSRTFPLTVCCAEKPSRLPQSRPTRGRQTGRSRLLPIDQAGLPSAPGRQPFWNRFRHSFPTLTWTLGLAGPRLMAKGPGGWPSNAPDPLAGQRPRPACRTPCRAICSKRLGREPKIFRPTLANDRAEADTDPPTIGEVPPTLDNDRGVPANDSGVAVNERPRFAVRDHDRRLRNNAGPTSTNGGAAYLLL